MSGKPQFHTIDQILKQAEKQLRPKKITCPADKNLGWLDAEILLSHILKKDKAWIIAHGNDALSPVLEKKFLTLVERRKTQEPIAYIIGEREFYGRVFKVNKTVLIPQPDTEILIESIKKRFKKNESFTCADIGTGSGAIAITIAKEFPKTKIIASDICKRALKVAEQNRDAHDVKKRVELIQSDLLAKEPVKRINKSATKTDELVIIANLPYLPESDIKHLSKEVGFEPKKALFAKDDGLALIKKCLMQINEELQTTPSLILLEFDPPQAKTLLAFAKQTFPLAKIDIIKDLAGRQRVLEIIS